MKKELLAYLTGLCQAASAALLASAVIMPNVRAESVIGCIFSAALGAIAVILKSRS